jgi:hypothetical protein
VGKIQVTEYPFAHPAASGIGKLYPIKLYIGFANVVVEAIDNEVLGGKVISVLDAFVLADPFSEAK